jgi:hypothetical protein
MFFHVDFFSAVCFGHSYLGLVGRDEAFLETYACADVFRVVMYVFLL